MLGRANTTRATMRATTGALRRSLHVMGLGVLAIALSGCFLPLAQHHQEVSPDTRPWWCESEGGGGGHHGSEHYHDVEKGMLGWDDCLSVSASLQEALAYAMQYPTAADAEAAGFAKIVPYATGMGTHHLRGDIGDEFDPTRPEFLQYDGNGPDAELVGMSWYVRTADGAPPAGFPGDNDWWHVHEALCFSYASGLVIGDGLTDEECEARGGYNVDLSDFWMVHAWIVPGWQHHPDVFVNHHPCLLPGGPAAPDHECWDGGGHHGG